MRPASRRSASRRQSHRLSVFDIVLAAAALGGLLMATRPVLDDMHATSEARDVITSMTAQANETDNPQRVENLHQAQFFNAALAPQEYMVDNANYGGSNGSEEDILDLLNPGEEADVTPYGQQLLWNGYPAMCWVEIPAIGLREPVYHGTSDEALSQGIGHVEWSSLPVGGTSSHCVLAAHSGMQETRMFDNLDKLKEGDTFVIHTLGDAYQYEVYDIEVVKPYEAKDKCSIETGLDLCTLVTCTPYGINSHRLLVHARRVVYTPPQKQDTLSTIVPALSSGVTDRRTQPALIAGVSLVLPLLLHMLSRWRQRMHGACRSVSDVSWRRALSHSVSSRLPGSELSRGGRRCATIQ